MGIKSDKTFEEIVERLVALFKPEPERRDSDADAVLLQPSTSNTAATDATVPSPSTCADDETQ